jgi:hypothetical protein
LIRYSPENRDSHGRLSAARNYERCFPWRKETSARA